MSIPRDRHSEHWISGVLDHGDGIYNSDGLVREIGLQIMDYELGIRLSHMSYSSYRILCFYSPKRMQGRHHLVLILWKRYQVCYIKIV